MERRIIQNLSYAVKQYHTAEVQIQKVFSYEFHHIR